MGGLRSRLYSGVRDREGLEYRRSRPWDAVQVRYSKERGTKIHEVGRQGIGEPAEEERGRRGGQG